MSVYRERLYMLYRSDEGYYRKIANLHAETAHSIASDKKHIDTDAHLSQAERDRIYEDHVHIPNEFYREGTDDDDTIRLPKELAEGMSELTDLQREVIFRNVINGEPPPSSQRRRTALRGTSATSELAP